MYATIQDVKDALDSGALLRLVDDENEDYTAAGEMRAKQQARVNKALTDAGNEADTYIAQRYDLPLPSTPPVLRGKVVDIAVWNLFARRGLGDADEVVRERYKNAMRWLEQLSVGKVSLPLTPSGKIDRRALPAPEPGADAQAYTEPRGPIEAAIAAIWGEILGVPRVSTHAGFFELGGHSLLATQAVARLRAELGVELHGHDVATAVTAVGAREIGQPTTVV